jgi:carbonic anhydrase
VTQAATEQSSHIVSTEIPFFPPYLFFVTTRKQQHTQNHPAKMRVLSLAMLVVCAVSNADAFTPLKSIRNRFGKKTAMPPAPSLPPVELPKGVTDKDLNDIFAINKEWIKTKESADAEYFKRMGAYHKPDYMWIGCADARVPANEVMGKDAGEVFVARNVANMVVNTDVNLMAALQYAVAFLKVSHIIVCGHYDCGGVRASMTNRDHVPPLEDWLRNIRDV